MYPKYRRLRSWTVYDTEVVVRGVPYLVVQVELGQVQGGCKAPTALH